MVIQMNKEIISSQQSITSDKTDSNDKNINMVISQTDYTKDEASAKLQLFDNDPMKVIRDYMGIGEKSQTTQSKTGSQERYRLIREVIYEDNHMKSLKK